MLEISEIITDVITLGRNYTVRDGFVFSALGDASNVFDAIVIQTDYCAHNRYPFSARSLKEHIKLVNDNRIEKAIVYTSSLAFLRECLSLREVSIHPIVYAHETCFDFSPLYSIPWLTKLCCHTEVNGVLIGDVDYAQMPQLKKISVSGKGHKNYSTLHSLESLTIFRDDQNLDLSFLQEMHQLKAISIGSCKVMSLRGVEGLKELRSLVLENNQRLSDISALANCAEQLDTLCITNCSRIKDFTVLEELIHLKRLILKGSNSTPTIGFLTKCKELQHLVVRIKVLDGDMSPCLAIAHAVCDNHRHYNLRNIDLPKCTK